MVTTPVPAPADALPGLAVSLVHTVLLSGYFFLPLQQEVAL